MLCKTVSDRTILAFAFGLIVTILPLRPASATDASLERFKQNCRDAIAMAERPAEEGTDQQLTSALVCDSFVNGFLAGVSIQAMMERDRKAAFCIEGISHIKLITQFLAYETQAQFDMPFNREFALFYQQARICPALGG